MLELREPSSSLPAAEAVSELAAALHAADCLGTEELSDDERLRVVAYFPDALEPEPLTARLSGVAPGWRCVELERLGDPGWVERWNASLKPVQVGRRLVVSPAPGAGTTSGRVEIVVRPGRAFGTGYHESTRLALELLEEELASRDECARVWDVGTGSGILALAAARLGAASVLATDSDPEAIEVAAENVAAVAEREVVTLRVSVGEEGVDDSFDVIVANVTGDVLEPLAPRLLARLTTPGSLILSGLLERDVPVLGGIAEAAGCRVTERAAGEWRALWARW